MKYHRSHSEGKQTERRWEWRVLTAARNSIFLNDSPKQNSNPHGISHFLVNDDEYRGKEGGRLCGAWTPSRLPSPDDRKQVPGFEILKKAFLWAAFCRMKNMHTILSCVAPSIFLRQMRYGSRPMYSNEEGKSSFFGILAKYTLNWKTFNLNFSFSITFPDRSLRNPSDRMTHFFAASAWKKFHYKIEAEIFIFGPKLGMVLARGKCGLWLGK